MWSVEKVTQRSYLRLECALLTSVTSCLARLSAGHAEVAWPHILAGNFYPGDTAKAGPSCSQAVVNIKIKSQTEHHLIIIIVQCYDTEECRECAGAVAGEDAGCCGDDLMTDPRPRHHAISAPLYAAPLPPA